jgi:hypothetical protein
MRPTGKCVASTRRIEDLLERERRQREESAVGHEDAIFALLTTALGPMVSTPRAAPRTDGLPVSWRNSASLRRTQVTR